tara:strand:- start:7481 stop:7828 length:348 start_codon:yes stop_codon:yes gene_type:complete
MTFLDILQQKASLIAALFIVVCAGGGGMTLLDERMQGGLKYLIGSVLIGLTLGGVAMAFTDSAGIVLLIGVAGMATAPATIAWVKNKTILEVVDEVRRRRGPGPRDDRGDGGGDA